MLPNPCLPPLHPVSIAGVMIDRAMIPPPLLQDAADTSRDDADIDSSRNDDPDASTDAEAPIASNDALDPQNDANADPQNANDPADPTKRFLTYAPFAKQCDFHKSPAKYRLFGGAAGPGKSKALLMEAMLQANDNWARTRSCCAARFPSSSNRFCFISAATSRANSTRASTTRSTSSPGSTDRPLASATAPPKMTSTNIRARNFFSSASTSSRSSLSASGNFSPAAIAARSPRTFPNMAGATNPGNIGHAWVKSLWIDKQPAPGMESPECYDPADYDFIPARVHDNPIYAADENYLKTLARCPSHLRRAFLDGDWEVFAGQYFDNFDVTRHVARAERSTGSRGGRAGSPSTGASSTRRPRTGTPPLQPLTPFLQ